MICPKCGREIPNDSVFCPHCKNDLYDNSISFNNLNDGMQILRKETKKALIFSIVSIILSGLVGAVLAFVNMSKIDNVNRMDLFPSNVNDLDEYEKLKRKLRTAKFLSIIAVVLSFAYIFFVLLF